MCYKSARRARVKSARSWVVLAAILLNFIGFVATSALAQTLPIPERRVVTGETTAPVASGANDTAAAEALALRPDTSALIDLLRDDAAREALIAQLSQANVTSPAETAGTEAAVTAERTVAEQTAHWARQRLAKIAEEAHAFWLRVKRVPATLTLAARALDSGLMQTLLAELALVASMIYGAMWAVRFVLRPLRRRMGHNGATSGWMRRLVLRSMASLGDAAMIPLVVIAGLILTAIVLGGTGEITDQQSVFISAFVAVEGARVAGRFVLSPHTSGLRIIGVKDHAARSLWRVSLLLIYLLGYGQLLIVPIIQDLTSIFVARAVSSILGAVTVLLAITYVMVKRHPVAEWLHNSNREGAVDATLDYLADRWHWPIIAYLLYLLTVVLTRPGNVLLPLLWDTGLMIASLVAGLMAMNAVTAVLSRKIRVPQGLARRLPLLQMRLNGFFPAVGIILRSIIILAVVVSVLSILGLIDPDRMLTSRLGQLATTQLASVLLVAAIAAVIWLALTSWVDYRLNPFVGSVPTPRETTLLTLLKNAATIALVIVAFMFSLAQLGMNIGPLLASAGVLGLAISFGAQRLVEDIITGIFIQFENAMNVGDVVDVGGTSGVVEKLTVRSVTLRDLSGVVHMIPFSSASKISNYMRDFAYHVADMGVGYGEDIDTVRQAMLDSFEELRADPEMAPKILGDLEWFGLNSFGDSAVTMRARIKTSPGEQWGVGRAYNAILKRVFDSRDIEIPYPHQTLFFGESKSGQAPALRMKVERNALRRQSQPSAKPPPWKEEAAPPSQDMPDEDGD